VLIGFGLIMCRQIEELKDEIKSGYKLEKEEISYKIDDADKTIIMIK